MKDRTLFAGLGLDVADVSAQEVTTSLNSDTSCLGVSFRFHNFFGGLDEGFVHAVLVVSRVS